MIRSGLHHNLSPDTFQKLETLITAYNGDIPENQDLFLTLIASGQQFKDKLHKDPDVEAVLNAKENKNIKSQKYIEKYLAPNEAIKYFLKCDENIAKAIIKNNKLLIWQKIEDIAAEIENSNQVELYKKNLAYLEYKQAIDESNDKNDIKQFIKRSYLEAIEQPSPLDNSLDYNEDSNKKMTNYLKGSELSRLWYFWLFALLFGLLLFIPAVISFATVGFIFCGTIVTLYAAYRLHNSQVNHKNLERLSSSLKDDKIARITKIINGNKSEPDPIQKFHESKNDRFRATSS